MYHLLQRVSGWAIYTMARMTSFDYLPHAYLIPQIYAPGEHDALRSLRLPGNSKTLRAQFPMRVE